MYSMFISCLEQGFKTGKRYIIFKKRGRRKGGILNLKKVMFYYINTNNLRKYCVACVCKMIGIHSFHAKQVQDIQIFNSIEYLKGWKLKNVILFCYTLVLMISFPGWGKKFNICIMYIKRIMGCSWTSLYSTIFVNVSLWGRIKIISIHSDTFEKSNAKGKQECIVAMQFYKSLFVVLINMQWTIIILFFTNSN